MYLENNLIVEVVDSSGTPLKEWGQQKFGDKRLSCYVQSETGMSFGLRLVPAASIRSEMDDRRAETKRWYRTHSQDQEAPLQPFDFLATLRLDGRETPEKCNIVYLDPANEWYRTPSGEIDMCGKMIRESKDSDVHFHKWVFQEVGIESMIEELSLQFDTQVPEPEDPLVKAMQDMGSNNLADKEETAKAGVIEISIQRVIIEQQTTQRPWDANGSTSPEAAGGSKTDRNISHTAGRTAGKKASSNIGTFVYYNPIDADDKPYAVFKFFYRSEEVLRKFDFRGFPSKQIKPDAVALAKLGLGDAVSKRGTAELDHDSDSDSDNDEPTQRRNGGRKTRKAKKKTEQDSPRRLHFPDQAAFSEDEDIDEEEVSKRLEEDDRSRGVSKPVFIDQPVAGPERAVLSNIKEHVNGNLAQPTGADSANKLIETKQLTADEVVQQKPDATKEVVQQTDVESDEEL
ncbi:uncharacterized protein CLAFUR5_05635 [Fulvia fulva]|uniref:DUF7918 domain-containing protein n=1 Tax=Passalora fulva TaxID=5499 RepID=A0A9Q8P9T1_PASFU|nr:uncharacterized protein CLAFUR5_05635 [Fulvia fulva]KAK4624833.1 hypothetical protein CLAFUR0_05495 [Fulvia fulva]UJO18286.1 hypothetical protein CLAFUR5_05635 [Fulvia fulva]